MCEPLWFRAGFCTLLRECPPQKKKKKKGCVRVLDVCKMSVHELQLCIVRACKRG